jgi:hypothetical protein
LLCLDTHSSVSGHRIPWLSMGDHSHLSLGVLNRSVEGCSIRRILFHTENTLEVICGLFSGEVSVSASSKAVAKESSDLLETVLEEFATESKLLLRTSSHFALRIVEEGSTRMVFPRLIFDTVRRCALHPWKMVDDVDDSSSEVHGE